LLSPLDRATASTLLLQIGRAGGSHPTSPATASSSRIRHFPRPIPATSRPATGARRSSRASSNAL
jgi:hypothetical protein